MKIRQTITNWANGVGRAVGRVPGRPAQVHRLASGIAPPPAPIMQVSSPNPTHSGAGAHRPRLTVEVMDVSPSMLMKDLPLNRLENAKVGAIEYVVISGQMNAKNEAAVVAYSERAWVVCPWTPCTDLQTLTRAIQGMGTSDWTNITAGLQEAEKLLASVPHLDDWELLVHLLTDGQHNCGGSPKAVADRLKARGVNLDVVGIGGNPAAVNEPLLTELASTSPDGAKRYRFITEPRRLVEHYRAIAGRLTR